MMVDDLARAGGPEIMRLLDVVLSGKRVGCVLFEAYFDESGDDGDFPIMVVGGYVIGPERARLMETAWRSVLDRYGLPYFHMVENVHEGPDGTPSSGVCKGMPRPIRTALQTELMALIGQHVEFGVACACPPEIYDWRVDPYTWCVAQVAFGVEAAFEMKGLSPDRYSISLFYEQGHKNGGKAYDYFHNGSASSGDFNFSFIRKQGSGIVQAADILVWQYAKFIKDKVKTGRRTRADFRVLMETPTLFLNFVPHGDAAFLLPFYNDTLDSQVDEENLRQLYSGELKDANLKEWALQASIRAEDAKNSGR